MVCATSGNYNPSSTGGTAVSVTDTVPVFTLDPSLNFANAEMCTVIVFATSVTDDALDPPDNMAADFVFSFTTASP